MRAQQNKIMAGAVGAALIFMAGSVQAQTSSSSSQNSVALTGASSSTPVSNPSSLNGLMNQFADTYGAQVILRGDVSLTQPVSVAMGSGMSRTQAIRALSAATGVPYHKIFFVAPASASRPITTAAAAAALVGANAQLTLHLSSVSAHAAARSVAIADNAEIRFRPGISDRTVAVSGTDLPLGTVIARIAQQTHTHWSVAYVLDGTSVASNPNVVNNDNSVSTAAQVAANVRTGPITVHIAPTPANASTATAGTTGAIANGNGAYVENDGTNTPPPVESQPLYPDTYVGNSYGPNGPVAPVYVGNGGFTLGPGLGPEFGRDLTTGAPF